MASTSPLVAIMERLREKLKANPPKKAKSNAKPPRTLDRRTKQPSRKAH